MYYKVLFPKSSFSEVLTSTTRPPPRRPADLRLCIIPGNLNDKLVKILKQASFLSLKGVLSHPDTVKSWFTQPNPYLQHNLFKPG